MRFSERHGFRKVDQIIQTQSLNETTRNCMWNILTISIFDSGWKWGESLNPNKYCTKEFYDYIRSLWHHFFKGPLDEIPDNFTSIISRLRRFFFESQWHVVMDFIEFTVAWYKNKKMNNVMNKVFETELVGYRIIDDQIAPITDPIEIEAIDSALEETTKLKAVNIHLGEALSKLSDRVNPDYRNSIKESISAVEAFCKVIPNIPNSSLGEALAKLSQVIDIHPALKKAYLAIYGYTSDADGIRHALLDSNDTLRQEDALYFLVVCSAFINFMIQKVAAAGIIINQK